MLKYFLFLIPAICFAVSDQTKIMQKLEVTATTTSTQVVAGDTQRNYLLIQNRGTVAIYVNFNGAHEAGEYFVKIIAGGNYEPLKVMRDSIFIKSESGSQPVTIIAGDQP